VPDSALTDITPAVKLLNSRPDIPGYGDFIGTYMVAGEKRALVDVGPRSAVSGVLASLRDAGVSPGAIDYIILTHIHIDHGGGTGTALRAMQNARVLMHPRGRQHMVNPAALWQASLDTLGELARKYGEIEPVADDRILDAADGMKLDLGKGVTLEVLMTPGHAAHHISLFEPAGRVLLAGDSAGVYSSGSLRLTTPPPFRLDIYLASLDRMIALNPQVLCYAHFGAFPDAVGRLRAAQAKAKLWFDAAQRGVQTGKTAEQVAENLRAIDPDLAHLGRLAKEEFNRDFSLLVTSVHGLMTAKG
jgi:glyoxylase-like metal-dependent hydrolase (beta-lactamase superfamily II)